MCNAVKSMQSHLLSCYEIFCNFHEDSVSATLTLHLLNNTKNCKNIVKLLLKYFIKLTQPNLYFKVDAFYAMQFFPCSCFHAATFLSSKYVYLQIGLSFTNITVGKLVKAPMQKDQEEDH
jgi:hypothetical protein